MVYQEYEPPKIRYRYPGEDWQELIADNYELEQPFVPGAEQLHRNVIKAKAICISRFPPINSLPAIYEAGELFDVIVPATLVNRGAVASECSSNGDLTYWRVNYNYTSIGSGNVCNRLPTVGIFRWAEDTSKTISTQYSTTIAPGASKIINFQIERDESYAPLTCNNSNCFFKVYYQGELIYEEDRVDCPEVEIIPCKLSEEYKEIDIDKIPYLERVEVTEYAYQNFGFGVYQGNIPVECLNIYKNTTATIIPISDIIPVSTNSPQSAYGFIGQICSYPGCPPPKYDVVCQDCELCPEETCPVQCGDKICCYDQDGVAVKEIALEDYCQVDPE